MKIGDVLYFSPKFRFEDLDFDRPELIAKAFEDRVEGYYFAPAAGLVQSGGGFAAGLVICAGIEFIAKANGGRQEPEEWLKDNVEGFKEQSQANRFWERFRHGLTHEGRIKAFGQFSFEMPEMITEIGDAMIVNPALLLKAVAAAFSRQCANMSTGGSTLLAATLRRYFHGEVNAAKG
jgi:hypothetical protein